MNRKLKIRNSTAEFLTFTIQAQEDGIEVRLQDETIWLSQKLMGVLFECSSDNIGLHLKHIFKEGELEENSVQAVYLILKMISSYFVPAYLYVGILFSVCQ